MPQRRNPFQGISQALNGVIQQLLTDELVGAPRREDQARIAEEADIRQAALRNPLQAQSLGRPDLAPDPQAVGQGIISEINTKTDPLELLPEDVGRAADLRRIQQVQSGAMLMPDIALGGSGLLDQIAAAREQQRAHTVDEQIKRGMQTVNVTDETGATTLTPFSPRTLGEGIQITPDAETVAQLTGEAEATQRQAAAPSDEEVLRLAGQENLAANATIDRRAAEAARLSAAQAAGQFDAIFGNPDRYQAQLEYEIAKLEGAPPGQSELTAAGTVPNLTATHVDMSELEDAGFGVGPGAMTVFDSPTFAEAMSIVPLLDIPAEERDYLGEAFNFGSLVTRILSGAQFREGEYQRYVFGFTALQSDTPEMKLQKRQRRERWLTTLAPAAGKAGPEMGQTLALLVKQGDIPMDFYNAMEFADPRVHKAFIATLRDK